MPLGPVQTKAFLKRCVFVSPKTHQKLRVHTIFFYPVLSPSTRKRSNTLIRDDASISEPSAHAHGTNTRPLDEPRCLQHFPAAAIFKSNSEAVTSLREIHEKSMAKSTGKTTEVEKNDAANQQETFNVDG